MTQGFDDVWRTVLTSLPAVLACGTVLAVGWLLALGVTSLWRRARPGHEKAAGRLVFLAVALLALHATFGDEVTGPLLIAALATAAGVIVVGAGGGLITPMRHRWERRLNREPATTRPIRRPAAETHVIGEPRDGGETQVIPEPHDGGETQVIPPPRQSGPEGTEDTDRTQVISGDDVTRIKN